MIPYDRQHVTEDDINEVMATLLQEKTSNSKTAFLQIYPGQLKMHVYWHYPEH
jgi:hypothetical protein